MLPPNPYQYKHLNVAIGKDDMLFLYSGGHKLHEYFTGLARPSEASISQFQDNIWCRDSYCSTKGISYYHVLFPNKQTSLDWMYPESGSSIIPLFTSGLQLGSKIIDLSGFIRELGVDAWLKTDTHLCRFGETMTACKIYSEITGDTSCEISQDNLLSRPFKRERRGDLSIMLGDHGTNRVEQEILYNPYWIQHQFTNSLPGGNNGLMDIYINLNAPRRERLLIFGDSFGRASASCLSYFFEHTFFCRTPYMHTEIIDSFKPSIVCTQSIERYLPNTPADSARPNFLIFPLLERHAAKLEGSTGFHKALNAQLSYPRSPFVEFMSELAS